MYSLYLNRCICTRHFLSIKKVIQHIVFGPASFTYHMFSGSTRVVIYWILFFLLNIIFSLWTYSILFVHSSAGYLWFHFGTMMNSTIMDIFEHVFAWPYFISLGYIFGSGLPASSCNSGFNILKICFSKWWYHFMFFLIVSVCFYFSWFTLIFVV